MARKRRPESTAHQYVPGPDPRPRPIRTIYRGGAAVGYFQAETGPGEYPRTIVAAAAPMTGPRGAKFRRPGSKGGWQKEAWQLRREVGELRYAGERIARATSMVRFFIAKKATAGPDDQPAIVEDPTLLTLSRDMFGDGAATAQAVHRWTLHMVYNGESNVLVTDTDGDLTFKPYSVSEVTGRPGAWKIDDGVDEPHEVDESTEVLFRSWTPDPEKFVDADCPVRSVMPVARELRGLGQHVSAQIDSRLAGAGMLILPEGITLLAGQRPPHVDENGDPIDGADKDEDDDEADPFYTALMEAMMTAIADRDDASAVVPIMAKVRDDLVGKIQHVTFAQPFDAQAKDLRDEAIRRIALGMDSEPETLLGMSGANHWTGFLVDQNEVRLVIAPMAATLCHALTTNWLRPTLVADYADVLDPNDYVVWFDTTPLELRPDRSKDAQTLHQAGAVSVETLRRESGFADSDKPGDQERRERLLMQLLSSRPDLALQILPMLGVDVTGIADPQAQSTGQTMQDSTPGPLPGGDPNPTPPGRPEQAPPEGAM